MSSYQAQLLMIRVRFEYNPSDGKNSFSAADAMPAVPPVGDYIRLPELGGEYRVRKVTWTPEDQHWKAIIELRKPFASGL